MLGQLVNHIESRAAVELSQQLAPIANAPAQTVRHLAAHDDIAVSGPILEKSERLSDDDLVSIAKTKSQAHLAKIANRLRLNETVTEVLVDQGDAEVADRLAVNAGAHFSKLGIDQPAGPQGIAQPSNPLPRAAEPKPLRRPAVRKVTRDVLPPPAKHAYRQSPARELAWRPPPPRRLAREDVRQQEVGNRYDSRLRELEREVRALRADREVAMRRTADRRSPPRELRRDERERYAVSQRAPRRAPRDRYFDENR